jgi:hypothetical protein
MELDKIRSRAEARRRGTYLAQRMGKSLCFVQGDQNIANQAGAAVRSDLNNELQALVTNSQGNSAPGTTYRNQFWHDTTNNVIKRRNAANAAWLVVGTLDETFVLSRSSNTILGLSDYSKVIIATSAFTQTLAAAATLGDGWYCDFYNTAATACTIDPNGAETINGAATLSIPANCGGRIVCNGSSFRMVVAQSADSAIPATATLTLGTGSGTGTLVGIASVQTTQVGNVGSGTDDLMSYTLPANSLSANGKAVRITAWGTTSGTGNSKNLLFKFGGSTIANIVLDTSVINSWRIEIVAIRTGSNAQKYNIRSYYNTGSYASSEQRGNNVNGSLTETDSGTIALKFQAIGTADDDIVQHGMLVEFLN